MTEYSPAFPGMGGNAVRMWGSNIVNSSCMSLIPEKGSHAEVSGLNFEMWVVKTYFLNESLFGDDVINRGHTISSLVV